MPWFHEFVADYWPHIAVVISLSAGTAAAIHAAMTKRDVRAAIGWVALAIFSPFFGALLYLVAGINRVRYRRIGQAHDAADPLLGRSLIQDEDVSGLIPSDLAAMKTLGDRVAQFPLTHGNRITPLNGGDEAYPAMLQAIEQATRTIALCSYIFDNDPVGQRMVRALAAARERGVEVRVLIDAIGARYSHPSIVRVLHEAGVTTGLFMRNAMGLRLAYQNMRSHRKVLVVDGHTAFTGGMNIRAGFTSEYSGGHPAGDVHFRVEGPIVPQLMTVLAHDWEFATGESLRNELWFPVDAVQAFDDGVPARVVASGPDRNLGRTLDMILGVLSIARHHVCIQSPYFLPDQPLIAALTIAARRGVQVDVVIPGRNNLRLVDYAMTAQLDQMVVHGVRIWRYNGPFDHAKLLTVDGKWSYVGSSNLDSRSLRLNFELDIEIYDPGIANWIARRIEDRIRQSTPETLETLRGRPFPIRLRNRLIWLASPYL